MSSPKAKNAVVLLSGGLDSATCAAIAQSRGYQVYALSAYYGQRHTVELDCAAKLASYFKVKEHRTIKIDLSQFGGSALTTDLQVPKHNSIEEIGADIPVTYVPARNTIFLSYALAFAEVIGSKTIFIGVNALDYSGYPDCRPEFISAFERMANLATKVGVTEEESLKIETPLIQLKKSEIIRIGLDLGVDYSLTNSCYDPVTSATNTSLACRRCDACLLRLKGFAELGMLDPIAYTAAGNAE
ncbi:MAG: 7-cyano-7-deazaguanine synthase QueC [Sumerlaeia bacterium]